MNNKEYFNKLSKQVESTIEYRQAEDDTVDVTFNGKHIGTLKKTNEEFGEQKDVWILFSTDINVDPVTYFPSLEETQECLSSELINSIDNQ